MSIALGLMLVGQVVVTSVRRNDEQIPLELMMTCGVTINGKAHQVGVELHGAIGAGSGVRVALDGLSAAALQLAGDHDVAALTSADDHTQNQLQNQFVVRAHGRRLLAALTITYPPAMPRPARFDNEQLFASATMDLSDLRDYRSVTLAGERLYVAKSANPVLLSHGPCVLRSTTIGASR